MCLASQDSQHLPPSQLLPASTRGHTAVTQRAEADFLDHFEREEQEETQLSAKASHTQTGLWSSPNAVLLLVPHFSALL